MLRKSKVLHLALLVPMALWAESGDLGITGKKAPETDPALIAKLKEETADLERQRQTVLDNRATLEKQWQAEKTALNARLVLLKRQQNEHLEEELKEKSRQAAVSLDIETLKKELAIREAGSAEAKALVRRHAGELAAVYQLLPPLLRAKTRQEEGVLRISQDQGQGLAEDAAFLQRAMSELELVAKGLWQGREKVRLEGEERLVEVIHFGLAAGCWLSLDGKDGGDLVKRDGIWEAQRRPEGLKVLAAAFTAARDGGDFALPLMVNKLKEAGK